jgi:hypothetical protein
MYPNQMYVPSISLTPSVFSLLSLRYMKADPSYDDKELYEYSKKILGIDLVVCQVVIQKYFQKRGLSLCFYESVSG